MTDRRSASYSSAMIVEAQVPFRFKVVHGTDPSRKSPEQKTATRSLSLNGLVFEIPWVEVGGLHISFTEASFGRNCLEISLELGRKWRTLELVGQVEWYEARPTRWGHVFIVGVSFVDVQPDALVLLKEFLRTLQSLQR